MIKICRIGVRKLPSTINGPVRYSEKNNCLHLSFHKFQAINDDQKIIASFMHGQAFFFSEIQIAIKDIMVAKNSPNEGVTIYLSWAKRI